MDSVKNYILSIVGAAIVCGVVKSLINEKTATGQMIKLLCGILITITVIRPLVNISFGTVTGYLDSLSVSGNLYVENGKTLAQNEMAAIIKEQTEAYILDKAAAFGADVEVEILMPADSSWQPDGVIISGSISPYAKERLQKIIAEDIQIPKENQQWIS